MEAKGDEALRAVVDRKRQPVEERRSVGICGRILGIRGFEEEGEGGGISGGLIISGCNSRLQIVPKVPR